MTPFTSHKEATLATSATIAAVLLVSICFNDKSSEAAPKSKSTRSGLYQFEYEEKGVTIRQQQFIELHSNGQWKMYRLPLQSVLRSPQITLRGTYKIIGQKITFRETKPLTLHTGPGRPSPIDTARFQDKKFLIISMADGIVISQSASNARYVKIR